MGTAITVIEGMLIITLSLTPWICAYIGYRKAKHR